MPDLTETVPAVEINAKSPPVHQQQSQIAISQLLSDNPRNSANSVIEVPMPISRQTTGDSAIYETGFELDMMVEDSPKLPDSFDTAPVMPAETQPAVSLQSSSPFAANRLAVMDLPIPFPPNMEPVEFNPRNVDYSHILKDERDRKLFAAMQIDQTHFFNVLFGPEEAALDRFMNTAPRLTEGHKSVVHFKLNEDTAINCVNWKDRCFITGTDIVRLLVHKFQHFAGKPPRHMKKFEEGIFSDLRRLTPPNDCVLEGTRSDFLVFLFDIDCVRSKKKQKVFFWDRFKAVAHNIFCDAVDRELARVQMAKAVGMTVDEFIKSGVVPTGTTSHLDSTRHSLSLDWPDKSLQMDESAAVAAGGFMKVDQIHIIRNDISQLFSRLLRVPVFDPAHTPAEKEYLVIKYLNAHMFKGIFAPPKPVPPTPQPTARQRARELQSMLLDDDDDIESSPPQHVVGTSRKTTRRRGAASKQSAPPTPKQSSRATPPTSFRFTPAGRRNQFSHLFASRPRDDDEYSVSTLSSNDDEYRMQYEYPTYIDHSYDDDYSTSTQMPLYLSGRLYTPQPEVSSYVRHIGSPGAIPNSPMSLPDLTPYRMSPKRRSDSQRDEYHIPAPKHSKRSHLLEDMDLADSVPAATGEAEAAYILLGISRSR